MPWHGSRPVAPREAVTRWWDGGMDARWYLVELSCAGTVGNYAGTSNTFMLHPRFVSTTNLLHFALLLGSGLGGML